MKYLLKYTLIVGMLLNMAACSKQLEENPPARYGLGNLNKEKLEALIIGAYEPLARSRGRLWESTLMRNLETMAEYSAVPAGSLDNYTKYNFEAVRDDGQNIWTTFYECIAKFALQIGRAHV